MEKSNKRINTAERYRNDPEFREQHLAKLKEKVECECGRSVTRANLAQHKLTNVHRVATGGAVPKTVQRKINYFVDLQEKIEKMDKTGWDKDYDKALETGVKACQEILKKLQKKD